MPYQYIATGFYPAFATRVYAYTRFERNNVHTVKYEVLPNRSALVRCPDRTVYLTNPARRWGCAPVDGIWDTVWEGDPFLNEWGEGFMPFAMISAHNGMHTQSGEGTSTGIRDRRWLHNGVKLFGDSGGSQLKLGTTDYIDPKAVLVWLNQVADVGVPLDVAPREVDRHYSKLFNALIHLQKRHNGMFLDGARRDTAEWNGLKLLNVAHGFTIDQIRKWCENTYDDRFGGWAVGTDGSSRYQSLRAYIMCIKEFSSPTMTHHHLFGAANHTNAPAMAWLGRLAGEHQTLSSDGTGWLDGVTYKRMRVPHLTGMVTAEHFGEKAAKAKTAMPTAMSPCSCRVCAEIGGYYEVFNMPRCTPGPTLLMLHELYVTNRWHAMVSNLAYTASSLPEYIEWITSMFTRQSEKLPRIKQDHLASTLGMIRFVDMCWNEGPEVATREFRQHLGDDPQVGGSLPTLIKSGPTDAKRSTFDALGFALETARTSTLPNYMTRGEMASFGLETKDVSPGVAEGYQPRSKSAAPKKVTRV